jgi:hypothetical protein
VKCGHCLTDYKSFLQLQLHKSQVHGEKNQMSRYNSIKEFQGGRADRQERTNYLDNKLHEEIKKFKESN